MIVPNYDGSKIVNEDGSPTPMFSNLLQTLLKNMTQSLGNEGFQVPVVSSDPASIDPPAAGGQLLIIQNSFQSAATPVNVNGQTVTVGAQAGTIVFDPYEVNGAVLPARNGQLKVLLNDRAFHAIVNL